jgi:hypothetical protein
MDLFYDVLARLNLAVGCAYGFLAIVNTVGDIVGKDGDWTAIRTYWIIFALGTIAFVQLQRYRESHLHRAL